MNKGMFMLKDLSMLLNIKENNYMLDNIIEYHAHTGIKLYVIHDSKEAYSLPSKYNNKGNIYYYHMPNVPQLERINFALKHVTTEFCVFRGDRRHQCNTILETCLQFLKENPDFSSASGIWLRSDFTPDYGIELISKDGIEDNVIDRVRNQFLAYQPPYYNVSKTALCKVFYDIISHVEEKISNIYYVEYIHAFLLFFTGKTAQFANFAGIVQDKKHATSYVSQWYKAINIFNDEELSMYVSAIIKMTLKSYNFSVEYFEESFHAFHRAMIIYFIIHRVNTYEYKNETALTFGYLENSFAMLNKRIKQDKNLLEYYLRSLMTENFCRNIKFNSVKDKFEQIDFIEIKNIADMINNINEKYAKL